MSVKPRVTFYLGVVGDGSTTQLTVTNATAPFGLQVVGAGIVSESFDIGSTSPSGIADVTSSGGGSVTASLSILGTTTTFTYATALANGVADVLSGTFFF